MLVDWQLCITEDTGSGASTAYLLRMEEHDKAWCWVADVEFGPFDTSMDVANWLHRQLIKHSPRRLR